MIAVLDSNAAVRIALGQDNHEIAAKTLKEAEWVVAPCYVVVLPGWINIQDIINFREGVRRNGGWPMTACGFSRLKNSTVWMKQ